MPFPSLTGLMSPVEAVNICLVAANLPPISSEVAIEKHVAGYSAWLLILEESRQVQAEGWHFNTNYEVVIEPNTSGNIVLPTNVLQAYVQGGQYAQRGNRLYNRAKNTYSFSSSVAFEKMIVLLDWDELIQQARYYIVIRAVRRYLASRAGSEIAKNYSQITEMDARVSLNRADAILGEPNAEFHSRQVRTWKRAGR